MQPTAINVLDSHGLPSHEIAQARRRLDGLIDTSRLYVRVRLAEIADASIKNQNEFHRLIFRAFRREVRWQNRLNCMFTATITLLAIFLILVCYWIVRLHDIL